MKSVHCNHSTRWLLSPLLLVMALASGCGETSDKTNRSTVDQTEIDVDLDADADDPSDAADAHEDGTSDQLQDVLDTMTDSEDLNEQFLPLPPLPTAREIDSGRFTTSPTCASCHSNSPDSLAMRDSQNREIGQFDLWQSTMMANSTRDPLWRAVVSAEVAATPAAAAAIEEKCMSCHAPAAFVDASDNGEAVTMALLDSDTDRAQLALDGVTCTACHQIESDNLGSPESFSGGFTISDSPVAYGPHGMPFDMPMVNQTGYMPTQSDHIGESEVCATCHTLHTDTLTAEGVATGERLPEQTPYFEWLNSDFGPGGSQETSCQGCHMPNQSVDGDSIRTPIARRPNGGDFPALTGRTPFGRHIFVGGNTLIPAILRDNPDTLSPLASPEAFDATIAAARAQLRNDTAEVSAEVEVDNNTAIVSVTVQNISGHKFPTGFPSRRAFLRVTARDANESVVWRSGDFDANGMLLDQDGLPLPQELAGGPMYPHHETVTAENQVQVYESVMGDSEGAPTYRLLRGATYLKDNRLLPPGWDPSHQNIAEMEPAGTNGDPDYMGGPDVLEYQIPVSTGVARVEVELYFQPLGTRFAQELFTLETPEIGALRYYLQGNPPIPELVSDTSVPLP